MATPTDAELLAAIKTAIYNIVSGEVESVEVMGKQWSLLNLEQLERLEKYYSRKVAAAARQKILLADVSRGTS